MKPVLKIFLIAMGILVSLSFFTGEVLAQCAMCRVTLENNVNNGEVGIAAGINTGILYLFAMPYILIALIGYMWYRKSKENVNAKSYSPR